MVFIVVQGSEKGSKRSLDPLILEWNEGVAGLLLEWIFCIRSGIFFAISSNPFLHWFPTWLGQNYGTLARLTLNLMSFQPTTTVTLYMCHTLVQLAFIIQQIIIMNVNKCYFNWIGKRIWIDLDPFLKNGILGGLECLPNKDLVFQKRIGIRIFEQLCPYLVCISLRDQQGLLWCISRNHNCYE